jgi:hypothetical protein
MGASPRKRAVLGSAAEAHETHFPFLGLPALERLLWIGGKVAGEDGKLLVAIEGAPADGLSGRG